MKVILEEISPEQLQAIGEASALEQILFNLVDNACKYGASEAVKEIRIQATSQGKQVWIRIQDQGRGISKKEAKKLFQPFSKSAHEAAHSAPGVGLGLALSRKLARSMKGDLFLEKSSIGACFVIVLPLHL
jgi:signal transduction histidine kinase